MDIRNFIFKRKIKLVQLADIIINDLHITRNDLVMADISLSRVNLIDSTPEDLIYLLKMIVGTEGTILMPDFSVRHRHPGSASDTQGILVRNDSLIELFRQMPETIQSILPGESFAAWGRMAKKIAEEPCKNEFPSYMTDLFYKLSFFKTKIVGIGVSLTDFSIVSTPVKQSNDERSEFFAKEESVEFQKKGIPFFRIDAERSYNKAMVKSKSHTTA